MSIDRQKHSVRDTRKKRTHKRIRVIATRPRLSVFRSNKYVSAQIIDDKNHKTLCSASSKEIKDKGTKTEVAKRVGEELAKRAKDAKVKEVVFDRGRYAYHGRVRALAEGAREGGLKL